MARADAPVQKIALLMTRPKGSNTPFVAQLAPDVLARLTVVKSPLIAIVPRADEVAVSPEEAVIFSSANGVKYAPVGQGRRAYCVGRRTTDQAASTGWQAVFAGHTADALVDYVLSAKPTAPLHHLRGAHQRGEIADRLTAAGLPAKQTVVYDQPLQPLTNEAQDLLGQNVPVIVPLFSPRAATQFAACSPRQSGLNIVCLSSAVQRAATLTGENEMLIPAAPEARLMLEMVEMLARRISLG